MQSEQSYRIGIIWSGRLQEQKALERENIIIYQQVRMDSVQKTVAELEASGVFAIIGTPGTETLIRKYASVPVIIAYTTYIDLLETIRDAELKLQFESRRIALILHKGNPIEVERLTPFSKSHIEMFPYEVEADLVPVMETIRSQEFELVIGGPTAVSLAQQFGISAYMLIYREQALQETIDKSREVLGLMRKEFIQTQRLRTVINMLPNGIVVTDETGSINMCNANAADVFGMREQDVLGRNVQAVTGDESWSQVYTKGVPQSDVIFEYQKSKYFSTRRPIIENDRVIGSVGTMQEAAKIQSLERKFRGLENLGLVAKYTLDDIAGESDAMQDILTRARVYARSDLTILIEGETGTGKELVSQGIHNASMRRAGPFVAINCATLTETLLASELFGYEEGAFTGAKRGGKMGLFERAHKGTIFLDEINQIPMQLQAKLLRVIQERVVMRLGGDRVIPVDVRIIAATNEDLLKKIEAHTFRSDLFYRVNVLNLHLPPLRERPADVPVLIRLFLRAAGADEGDVDKLCAMVAGYGWPGNVRELENFVQRYVMLSSQLDLAVDSHFLQEIERTRKTPAAVADYPNTLLVQAGTLEEMERQLIQQVVDRCGGNKSRAALTLDISRNTINSKMQSPKAVAGLT